MKKFLNALSTTILVIILLISTTALLILLPFKNIIKGSVVKEIISNLKIEKMVEENPDFKQTVNEVFEPILIETNKLGIDDDVIIKIIDSKEVKDLMGDITSNIIQYAVTGENQKIITNEDINTMVNDAINQINSNGYYKISDDQKNEILNIADQKAIEYQEIISDTSEIYQQATKENKDVLNNLRFILGNKLITYLIIIILMSILLIVPLKWKKSKWIKYCSVTILVSSILNCSLTLLYLIGNNLLFKLEYPYIYDIINKIINFSFILSISTFIIMTIILIIYHIINKKKND